MEKEEEVLEEKEVLDKVEEEVLEEKRRRPDPPADRWKPSASSTLSGSLQSSTFEFVLMQI